MSSEQRATIHQPLPTPAPPTGGVVGESAISMLADLESRVADLKRMHEQQAARDAELFARERAITERERSAEAPAVGALKFETELDQRELRVAGAETAVATKERWLGERESALAERERAARSAGDEAQRRERAMKDLDARLRERERSVESKEQGVARGAAANAEGERLVKELAKREGELAELARTLDERSAAVRESEAQVERDRAAVSEQARTLAGKSTDDPAHSAAINAGRPEQLQLELGEANAARASLQTELAQAKEEIERLNGEVTAAVAGGAGAVDEAGRLGEQVEGLRAEIARAQRAESETRDRSERAEREARAASDAHERAVSERAQSHSRELALRDARIAEYDGSLRAMSVDLEKFKAEAARASERAERAESLAGGDGASPDEIDKRDQALLLLKERLERIQSENTTLQAAVAAANERAGEAVARALTGTAEGPGADRRARLRRYKSLLQNQARKIVAAQGALQKRHADCEQVLAQRSRLSGIATELARREKRVVSARARTGALASLLYAAATLSVLAVLSWETAKRVWPGTFIARATIEADSRGRRPTPEQIAQWQHDHETLITDPRTLEFAAERMRRRGLAELGTPVDLSDRLSKDLYVQSRGPGSITVELKGRGAEHTALELDTYITALKSLADMARDERSNNMGVTISRPAAAIPEPLKDERVEHAGMLLAFGVLAAMVLGVGLWARLSRTKKKFDHSQAVEAALEQVDWASLEKSLGRPGATDRSRRTPEREAA